MNKRLNMNFLLYVLGRTVSFFGNTIQSVAIPLYILRNTGSGTLIGLYAFVYSMPQIFMMPLGGIIGDRLNRKKIMITTDILSGISMLILVFFTKNNRIDIWILFSFQVIISSLSAIFTSSTSAMITEIVSEEELLKANSLVGSFDSASYILGPVAGAVLFSLLGIKAIFIINGISFLLSAVTECFIRYTPDVNHANKNKLTFKGALNDINDGMEFLKNSKGIIYLIVFAAISNFFGWASFSVIIPYAFINGIGFSDKYFGILEAAITIGILLGNLFLSITSGKLKRKQIIISGLFSQALVFILIGIFFYPSVAAFMGGAAFSLFLVFFILLIIFGIANAIMRTTIFTNLQTSTPNHMKARVFSAYTFFMQSISPLSVLIAGILIDKVKYYNLFMIYALMIFALTVIFVKKAPLSALVPKKPREKEMGYNQMI